MSSLNTEERIAAIQDMELQGQEDSLASAHVFDEVAMGQQSAAVAGGSAFAFAGNLTSQMKHDVLNSTLLAQIFANSKYDRTKEADKWYEFYRHVLENLGWILQRFDLNTVHDPSSYVSVDKLVIKLAGMYLSGGELGLFTTMIDSLRQPENSTAMNLFDSSSKSSKEANFQLGVAIDAKGDVMLRIGGYSYSASQDIDQVLFFEFGSQDVDFRAAHQTMVLNERIYSTIRQAVLDKLGDSTRKLIASIEL